MCNLFGNDAFTTCDIATTVDIWAATTLGSNTIADGSNVRRA